jgi:hypothetical protein
VGNAKAGAIVALDMEGRWFAVLDGEVLNRVNADAIAGHSTRERYLNPGGDGLWPAPEGTSLGYQYAADAWRVAPGLCAARYLVTQAARRSVAVAAEVDLVNNRGLGIPTIFRRRIAVVPGRKGVTVKVVESIACIGRKSLRRAECSLAPWTLCQFDCGPGCEVVFPCRRPAFVEDLYDPSDDHRDWTRCLCRTRTDGSQRYQIGLPTAVPWIEFRDPRRGLVVRRTSAALPAGESYIDIRDAAPHVAPKRKGVRYGTGATKMGEYGFASWSIFMASIIIFSNLWGLVLNEWKGVDSKTPQPFTRGLSPSAAHEVVGLQHADGECPLVVGRGRVPCVLAQQLLATSVIAAGRGAGAAGVFPLGLGREAIGPGNRAGPWRSSGQAWNRRRATSSRQCHGAERPVPRPADRLSRPDRSVGLSSRHGKHATSRGLCRRPRGWL